MNAEETKRWKAKNLRYKKPIVKDLNLYAIKESLWEIGDECDDVQYYLDYHKETLLMRWMEMKMMPMNLG